MRWINFLHFYQPATLENDKIIEATEKSYNRIIKALLKNNNARFTINISGTLLEKLNELKYHDLINNIKILIKRGQIEITGTAAHHALLPLIPAEEIKKQINHQENLLNKYFAVNKPAGFFLPEMAYSDEVAKIIKKLGYQWLILDEITHNGQLNKIDHTKVYQDDNNLKLIFRNRQHSQNYVPQVINNFLKKGENATLITATDAELYGLRHNDISGHFEKTLQHPNLQTNTISDFIADKDSHNIKPVSSSWESTEQELKNNLPFALWHDPKNKIQTKILKLIHIAIVAVKNSSDDPQYEWAQKHLNQGLASCTLWWASGKKLPIWEFVSWSPDEIERGLNEIIKSIRSLENLDIKTKLKAEKLYINIKKLIWQKHWKKHWKK